MTFAYGATHRQKSLNSHKFDRKFAPKLSQICRTVVPRLSQSSQSCLTVVPKVVVKLSQVVLECCLLLAASEFFVSELVPNGL